jgi:hypothetical protein
MAQAIDFETPARLTRPDGLRVLVAFVIASGHYAGDLSRRSLRGVWFEERLDAGRELDLLMRHATTAEPAATTA